MSFGALVLKYSLMKKFFRRPIVLSLLLVFVLVIFYNQGWLKTPQDFLFKITLPLQKTTYNISLKFGNFVNFIKSAKGLNQENSRLKRENSYLLGEISRLNEISLENEILRQQLGLGSLDSRRIVMANLAGRSSSDLSEFILINKGQKEGVSEGMSVVSSGNRLVGRVIEANELFSKVQLVIDPRSRINVMIQNSRATGLVSGDKDLLLIDLLPQGEEIKAGELVVTSGLAGVFPAGLLIGQIERVISNDVQISRKAEIKPSLDFNKLEKVFVLIE